MFPACIFLRFDTRFLPGAEKERAHAQLASYSQSMCQKKLGGGYEDDGYYTDDLCHHTLRSGQAAKARELLMQPALCEARIHLGRGQALMIDIEYAIAHLPGSNDELEKHKEFLARNHTRMAAGATFKDILAATSTMINSDVLRGAVSPTDHLHSRIVRIFTSSTFDDLKVSACTRLSIISLSLLSIFLLFVFFFPLFSFFAKLPCRLQLTVIFSG